MKIICTAKEFATLVRECERKKNSPTGCNVCVFLQICLATEEGFCIEDAAKFEVREHG